MASGQSHVFVYTVYIVTFHILHISTYSSSTINISISFVTCRIVALLMLGRLARLQLYVFHFHFYLSVWLPLEKI